MLWIFFLSEEKDQKRNSGSILAAVSTEFGLCILALLYHVSQCPFSCRWQKTHCNWLKPQRGVFSLLDWEVQVWPHPGSNCCKDLVSVLPSFSDRLSTWKGRMVLDMYRLSLANPWKELLFLIASTWSPGIVFHWTTLAYFPIPELVTLASSSGHVPIPRTKGGISPVEPRGLSGRGNPSKRKIEEGVYAGQAEQQMSPLWDNS